MRQRSFTFFFLWKFPVDKRQKIAAGVHQVASPRSALTFFFFVCLKEEEESLFEMLQECKTGLLGQVLLQTQVQAPRS